MTSGGSRELAVVLLSGGLDSATTLAVAVAEGWEVMALTVDYGQRHLTELRAAEQIASQFGVAHEVVRVELGRFGGSALTDPAIEVPKGREIETIGAAGIPVTYVPARNTVLLALALAAAEASGSSDVFIGVNAVDYSGYPDCRPEFVRAFETLAKVGTRAGVEGAPFRIHAPLISMSKADIVRKGLELGVDFASTVSCYDHTPEGACGRCDACTLRLRAFADVGVPDPARYRDVAGLPGGSPAEEGS